MADLNPPTTYTPEVVGKVWEGHGDREVEDALRRLAAMTDYLRARIDENDANAVVASTTAAAAVLPPSAIFALMIY